MEKILAVDDDKDIVELINNTLTSQGYRVDTALAVENVDMDKIGGYDLILLDVMLPGTDGFAFCKKIRSLTDCPIIFLTAKTEETDIISGLGYGADDYICKPFGIRSFIARIAAHLRRENRERHIVLVSKGLRFDLSEKIIACGEEQIDLTKSEYEICEYLAKNKGQVFTMEQIYDYLYGFEDRGTPTAIREHIKNIRAKFKKYGFTPIETVWGIGYKWK